MSFSRFALAILFLALPTLAFAQDGLELSIAPITTANKPLTISELIEIEVTLTNKSEKTIEDLTEFVFDQQSVSFDVSYQDTTPKTAKDTAEAPPAPTWGKTFLDTRIHGEWGQNSKPNEPAKFVLNPKIWKKVKLEKGKSLKTRILMPLLKAGKLRVVGVYRGAKSEMKSKPAVLDIKGREGKLQTGVLLTTNRGEVMIELKPDAALGTCNHFVRAIAANFYNGTTFHRVINNNIIQGGDPQGDGRGGPGYFIPAEFSDLVHKTGTVSMARAGAEDSAGCQFYIALRPRKDLDNSYTIFAKVVGDQSVQIVRLHSQTATTPRSLGNRPENSDPVQKQFIRSMKLLP